MSISVFQQFDENVGNRQSSTKNVKAGGLRSRQALGDITNKNAQQSLQGGKLTAGGKSKGPQKENPGPIKNLQKENPQIVVKVNKKLNAVEPSEDVVDDMEFVHGKSNDIDSYDGGLGDVIDNFKNVISSSNNWKKPAICNNKRKQEKISYEPFGSPSLDDKLGDFESLNADVNLDSLAFDFDVGSDSD